MKRIAVAVVLAACGCGDDAASSHSTGSGTSSFTVGDSDSSGFIGSTATLGGSDSSGSNTTSTGGTGNGSSTTESGGDWPLTQPEARCTQLGDECLCAETFDSDQIVSGQVSGTDEYYGPRPVTEPKACPGINDWGAVSAPTSRPIAPFSAADLATPPGAPVAHVWHSSNASGYGFVNSAPIPNSARRFCWRNYFHFSADFNGDEGDCNASKLNQFNVYGDANPEGGGTQWHGEWKTSGGPGYPSVTAYHADVDGDGVGDESFQIDGQGGDLSLQDCKQEWCRYEACVSMNVETGRDMYWAFRVVGTSSGKTYGTAWPTGAFVGHTPGGGGVSTISVLNGYRQDDGGPGQDCFGQRFFNYAILAAWDTDARQTIGPACELEPSAPECSS